MICDMLPFCYKTAIDSKECLDCPNSIDKCITICGNISNVKCEENGKVYILNNTLGRHTIKYKIDGGVIKEDSSVPDGTNKCDFLYLINDKTAQVAILIELKGKSINKAITQLVGTLDIYRSFFNKFTSVYCRIVITSSTPKIKASPNYINLRKTVQKLNGNVKIAEKRMIEKDIDLDYAQ